MHHVTIMWASCDHPLIFIGREKKLLLGSTDYGKEMTGAQKLKKKHQRLENELNSHEEKIKVASLQLLF